MSSQPPPDPSRTAEEEEDDEQQMDVSFIQGFADKIQRVPVELLDGMESTRPKISIPKRGEKDFEPLEETVNLQEMMLQNSRQALFEALQGVRGVASKSLSHAIVTASRPFPQLLVARGHVLDSLGITVRREGPDGSTKSCVELLPEEALYLVERGSLQIWNGRDPETEEEMAAGVGAWSDEEFGVKGAVELSVMEAFGLYMGQEGLSWQRYQAYAYLKRLGYTVQRTRRFLPEHFLAQFGTPKSTSTVGLGQRCVNVCSFIANSLSTCLRHLVLSLSQVASWLTRRLPICRMPFLSGHTYASVFTRLRFIPAGHRNTVPVHPKAANSSSIYTPLVENPYLPFFHIWKPVTSWSKAKWDRGSPHGLTQQPPDYYLAVVESRETPLPALWQLDSVFSELPDEAQGPTRRIGPQYQRPQASKLGNSKPQASASGPSQSVSSPLRSGTTQPPRPGNAMAALRNGDRGLIVAVNDSGNTGWVRFGRTGFEAFPMI